MLDFTKQEKQVLQFILIIILCGAIISFLQKSHFYPKVYKSFNNEIDKFNLNKVTLAQLTESLGINHRIAQRIVDYRQQNGGFGKIDELMDIKGIGEKSLFKLKPKLYINNE